jgi:outer membrane protein assembly factor BamB
MVVTFFLIFDTASVFCEDDSKYMRCLTFLCCLALWSGVLRGADAATSTSTVHISSLGPEAVTRSGPVTIRGTGFGQKKSGFVLIGGERAWTTLWNDSQIVAYVPETAAIGANRVEIVSGGVTSAGPDLMVEERPATTGTVAWRFEVLANYISHRADVGRDGTVYFNDSSGFLYALTPAGALKWVYDGESVGSSGHGGSLVCDGSGRQGKRMD